MKNWRYFALTCLQARSHIIIIECGLVSMCVHIYIPQQLYMYQRYINKNYTCVHIMCYNINTYHSSHVILTPRSSFNKKLSCALVTVSTCAVSQ